MRIAVVFLLILSILLFGCTSGAQNAATNGATEDLHSGETAEEKALEQKAMKDGNTGTEKSAASENIAGTVTPYSRYNEVDFNKARSEGKIIYMYFYATWCPICNEERPIIFAAFNEMKFDDVVGFEVHFNDPETTDEDRGAAKKFGVAYQHTTIILAKNGAISYKSLSPISEDEIKSKISDARKA